MLRTTSHQPDLHAKGFSRTARSPRDNFAKARVEKWIDSGMSLWTTLKATTGDETDFASMFHTLLHYKIVLGAAPSAVNANCPATPTNSPAIAAAAARNAVTTASTAAIANGGGGGLKAMVLCPLAFAALLLVLAASYYVKAIIGSAVELARDVLLQAAPRRQQRARHEGRENPWRAVSTVRRFVQVSAASTASTAEAVTWYPARMHSHGRYADRQCCGRLHPRRPPRPYPPHYQEMAALSLLPQRPLPPPSPPLRSSAAADHDTEFPAAMQEHLLQLSPPPSPSASSPSEQSARFTMRQRLMLLPPLASSSDIGALSHGEEVALVPISASSPASSASVSILQRPHRQVAAAVAALPPALRLTLKQHDHQIFDGNAGGCSRRRRGAHRRCRRGVATEPAAVAVNNPTAVVAAGAASKHQLDNRTNEHGLTRPTAAAIAARTRVRPGLGGGALCFTTSGNGRTGSRSAGAEAAYECCRTGPGFESESGSGPGSAPWCWIRTLCTAIACTWPGFNPGVGGKWLAADVDAKAAGSGTSNVIATARPGCRGYCRDVVAAAVGASVADAGSGHACSPRGDARLDRTDGTAAFCGRVDRSGSCACCPAASHAGHGGGIAASATGPAVAIANQGIFYPPSGYVAVYVSHSCNCRRTKPAVHSQGGSDSGVAGDGGDRSFDGSSCRFRDNSSGSGSFGQIWCYCRG
ncbi:hypothetical protein VOLCADRAFT_86017 [Volvox carteri f. nagariensis]|uniref:Uncharacterized protein n=1 Tax=Volvox carteri f. nagariensis TaxID=3068 RepID=D8THL9_VOLCA|nr:uncharacterized protein VOLCADRAFT_86017 [Volvox carteri f. nagariensis]EFJ52735.1 hypothetical protein VOLCADRAFT_86017 [Volvox carteri f. nagariensis]|eukprot:XP_002945740.1 hypothetical protein VOLCADRAFT_86017 [Volvox carteri f. nagariensis]